MNENTIWKIERWSDGQGSKGISIKDAAGLCIANMVMQLDNSEMEKARLIAAAPTMYEFIKKASERGDADAIAIVEAVNGNA